MAEPNRIACKRYADKNREKRRALSLKWWKDDKTRTRAYQLKAKYGITLADYETMLEQQNGVCAICRTLGDQPRRKFLCVDHCHTTKKVRGSLCSGCNAMLGQARDQIIILEAAINYLI